MKSLVAVFLFFSISNAFSQDIKLKVKRSAGCREVYYIDKSSKEKQGDYYKLDDTANDTLIKGHFHNDKKQGTWNYYSSDNQKYIAFNYDKNKVEFIAEQALEVDSFFVKVNNEFAMVNVDNQPLYLGQPNEGRKIIARNLEFPLELAEKGTTGISVASFIISEEGTIINAKIEKSLGIELDVQILKCINLIKEDWIPAMKEGNPVQAQIILLVEVSNSTKSPVNNYFPKGPHIWTVGIQAIF